MVVETEAGLFEKFVEREFPDPQLHRAKCQEAWDRKIKAGMTPREIMGLDPWPRPPKWTLSDDVIARAKAVVAALHARGVRMDDIAMDKLGRVAARTWTSVPAGVEETIAQAESAVRQHDGARQAAANEQAGKGRILVRHNIGRYTGNLLDLREYDVTAEELQAVELIVEQHRADAAMHKWEYPSGFDSSTWPPLEILRQPATTARPPAAEPAPAGPFIVR